MERHNLRYEHDPRADALYIRLADKPYAFGEDLDHQRRIDYADDHTAIGIELLAVSRGVETDGLPERDAVIRVLEKVGVPVFA